MVKNSKGGSGARKSGSKFAGGGGGGNRGLREVDDEDEMYAAVVKIFGNGMCEVMCNDSKKRLCIIRNKFRGRGKRDNVVASGTWVMVGIRSWESGTGGGDKLQKCDLLEVYSDVEKQKLKKMPSVLLAGLVIDAMCGKVAGDDVDIDNLEFSNADNGATNEISKVMAEEGIQTVIVAEDGDLVAVDDI